MLKEVNPSSVSGLLVGDVAAWRKNTKSSSDSGSCGDAGAEYGFCCWKSW